MRRCVRLRGPAVIGDASDRVRAVVVPRLASALGVEMGLVTDDLDLVTLGLSSLEMMETVYDAEEYLDLDVPEEMLAEVSTVGGLITALAGELERSAGS